MNSYKVYSLIIQVQTTQKGKEKKKSHIFKGICDPYLLS